MKNTHAIYEESVAINDNKKNEREEEDERIL